MWWGFTTGSDPLEFAPSWHIAPPLTRGLHSKPHLPCQKYLGNSAELGHQICIPPFGTGLKPGKEGAEIVRAL